MAQTFQQIIELAQRSGIANNPGSTVRPGDKAQSGSLSWHHHGKAVDFMGHNQDALAQFFMKFPTLEVIHYSEATKKFYGWNGSRGRPIDPAKNAALVAQHKDHLHVAMSEEQLGPGSVLDQLRKGLTPVFNAVGGAVDAGSTFLGNLIPNPGNVTDAIANVGTAMGSVAQSAMSIGRVADLVTKAFLPTNIIRGVAFFFGIIFILIGIFFLGREVKESTA